MADLLTASQMRAAEAAAMASGRVTGHDLMERAGHGVVTALLGTWPDLGPSPHNALVLCGPGNNGGDGFVVARLLRARGWGVSVALLGDPDQLPPDAKANHDRWRHLGPVVELGQAGGGARPPDLLIDAVFGTGLTRPLAAQVVDRARTWAGRARTVAVDLPSGICSDSGRALGGQAVRADLTVTFHRPKAGHYLDAGPDHCGRLAVVDIGLAGPAPGAARLVAGAQDIDKAGQGGPETHKYSHGHALVLSGGPGQTGAARLAAGAALRIGAGLVTIGTPPQADLEVACQITEIMQAPIPDASALVTRLSDQRITALCLGPGLGLDARAAALVAAALDAARPTVLDADALTLVARDADLAARLHAHCVLTPHAGEFRRLFPEIAAKLAAPASRGPALGKLDATRAAAAEARCTVLFKGPATVIASPAGPAAVNASLYDRAAPWLATAGSGDVLAGFIAGLLARGLPPARAATQAAWLHTECALSFGPGLIATDIAATLPAVLRTRMAPRDQIARLPAQAFQT